MKKLELNQMENVKGGFNWACAFGIASMAGILAVAATNPEIGIGFLISGEAGYIMAGITAETVEACAG